MSGFAELICMGDCFEFGELIAAYHPTKEAMEKVEDVLKQGDGRYSDPWQQILVAGFLTHGAIFIKSIKIEKPQKADIPDHKGPQKDLKRIAAWLLIKRGFTVEGCEVRVPGGIVDIVGTRNKERIFVECGPCRFNKPVEYLRYSNAVTGVLTRNHVLHEINKGKNWDSFLEHHKKEEERKLEESRKYIEKIFE